MLRLKRRGLPMQAARTTAPECDVEGRLHEGSWQGWIGIDAVEA
jgi:hypothetical protein